MKLVRCGTPGHEKPGVLDPSGTIRDRSGVVADIAGDALLPESIARLKAIDPHTLPAVNSQPRLGPSQRGADAAAGVADQRD